VHRSLLAAVLLACCVACSSPATPAAPVPSAAPLGTGVSTVDRAEKAHRVSRAYERPTPPPPAPPPPRRPPPAAGPEWDQAQAWAAEPKTRRLIKCESGDNPQIANPSGKYTGLYQFDRSTWQSNGGGQYADTARGATREQQNHIGWRLWKARGWAPWPACGRL